MAEVKNVPARNTNTNGDQKPARRMRKRMAIDPNESKADKFKRLANYRVPKAVKILTYIGGLANRSIYEYTDEQKELLINTLQTELNILKNRFAFSKEATVAKPIF